MAKEIIAVGKGIDEQVDALDNLSEPSPAGKCQRIINRLKKAGITRISQLRKMYNEYGENFTLSKLQELDRVGEELSMWIVLKAIDYNYPKGYTPQNNTLPSWVTEENITKEENKEEEEVVLPKATISMEELEKLCEEEPETESIDVEDYGNRLIKEEELPNILLTMIFDMFDSEEYNPERIDDNTEYEQDIIFYNDNFVLIEQRTLYMEFSKKFHDIRTLNNIRINKAFQLAVENMPGVYSKVNHKDGKRYYWGWKTDTLGYENRNSYIEFNISKAEQALNRKLLIAPKEQFNEIKSTFVKAANIESNKLYIVPEEINDGTFKFEIMSLDDRYDFVMNKRGIGVYSNNELLVGRQFTDEEYDEIERLIKEFLGR